MRYPLKRLHLGRLATVDEEDRADHVTARLGGQQQERAVEALGLAEAPLRHPELGVHPHDQIRAFRIDLTELTLEGGDVSLFLLNEVFRRSGN